MTDKAVTEHQLAVAREELEEADARITELVESEEKAWQTVAKLRVELETTDRLRIQVAELTTERDRAMKDLQRFKCSEHPDAIHTVRCTICRNERHVPA